MTEEEAEIEAVIHDRIDAIRSKDASGAVSTLTGDVLAFELAPPLAVSSDAARDVEAFAT